MSHFADSSFPKEILRKIFLRLDWKDRRQLYQTHPNISLSIATTVVYGDCDLLAQSEFMRIKLARSAILASGSHDLNYDRIMDCLSIAANIKALKIECNISNTLITLIVKALNKRESVKIFTFQNAASKWKSEIANLTSENITLIIRKEDGLISNEESWKLQASNYSVCNIGKCFKDEQQLYNQDYIKFAGTIANDQSLKDETEETVDEVAKQFVGCVIDFDFFKVFVTSVNAFVHLGDSIDDCANRIVTKDNMVFSKIREKPNYKSSSYEISIYIGSLELLIIGGVVVTANNEGKCFLGSSVKPLINMMSHGKETLSRDIYVKKIPAEVITSERLLRQYYKVHAGNKWSFHLHSLACLGFFPINPLRVKEHPLYNNNNDGALVCQSTIFRVYALRNLDGLELQELLKECRPMKNMTVDSLESVSSFVELKQKMKRSGKWEKIVEVLALVEEGPDDIFKDDKATKVKNKKLLLLLAEFGFFSSVSQKNLKIIKATEKLFLK